MTTTMQLIAKQTVGAGGAASVTFDNIPNSYTDLKLVMSARATRTGTDISTSAGVTFNGDNGSYYSDKMIEGGFGSTRSASDSGTRFERFDIPSDDATSSTFSNSEMYIVNYTSTNPKSVSYESVTENNASGAYMYLASGLYNPPSNVAIYKITLTALYSSTFSEFSTFYLYGISNSTTTQASTVPYASGGDVITTDGTYWYHAFLYSGTFTPLKALTADVLVVAGGGGAGGHLSGGGGAGGLRGLTAQALTSATNYTCTIGSGGTGYAAGGSTPTNGGNSSFAGTGLTTINASGGGAGTNGSGASGGSGGGTAGSSTSAGGTGNTGSYSPVEGYNGGAGSGGSEPNRIGGGGGGSSETGNTDAQGFGGDGVSTYSSWGSATTTGQNSGGTYYYAGGGAGSADYNGSATTREGGLGGGGNSVRTVAGVSGTANTGGGGGAGSYNGTQLTGGNGGSGIIIVRYAV
jgi:hypothetical protein